MATGGASGERVERALAVSALIGTDAAARGACGRVHAGHGEAFDALSALIRGKAADSERNAILDRHRRSAFARPAGSADEAAAADALVAFGLEAERTDADAAALDRAITVVLERDAARLRESGAAADLAAATTAAAEAVDAASSKPAAPAIRRWLRPVVAAAVIVAAIALGAGGENLVSGALSGPESGEATVAARDTDGGGDTEAADRWFEGEQSPGETAPPRGWYELDPSSVRTVHTGSNDWRVRIARGVNSEYCMSAGSGESAGFVCVDEREFAATGLVLGDGRDVASWNGAKFTLVFGRT